MMRLPRLPLAHPWPRRVQVNSNLFWQYVLAPFTMSMWGTVALILFTPIDLNINLNR